MSSILSLLRFIILVVTIFCGISLFALDGVETINVSGTPTSSVTIYNKLFVSNSKNNTVDVIDPAKNTVLKSIPVGKSPTSLLAFGGKVYAVNSGESTVSIIDAVKNEKIKDILVDLYPNFITVRSNKIYVTNSGSDTVSIIDPLKDIWLKNVKLGIGVERPGFVFITWVKLLIFNQESSNVSILDERNGSFKKIVSLSAKPTAGTLQGKKIYLYYADNNVISVFDADKENIASTIIAESGSISGTLAGTKIYVNHPKNNTVSVIDTVTDRIKTIIPVGEYPVSSTLVGSFLYVNNSKGNSVTVIDTTTDAVVRTIPVEPGPASSTLVGNKLYINSPESSKISVLYLEAPLLSGILSGVQNGTYGAGAKIDINMVFDQPLMAGSQATLALNNGATVTLSTVKDKILSGDYTVESAQNQSDLSVSSIKSIKIVGISGKENTSTSIPKGKNLGDYKNIVIDSSKVTTNPTTPVAPVCRDDKMYRTCPLTKPLENIVQFRENMICEGFISKDQPQSKRISRIEVLNIAVNMLRGPKAAATEYTNVYSDITPEGNSQETVSVIQTGLDNNLIFPNNGAFEPIKNISRIEAYALLMRGVCMKPDDSQDMARAIHQKALQNRITTKQWARFRAHSTITRNEVFMVTSALADWADKNGGCDKLECRK